MKRRMLGNLGVSRSLGWKHIWEPPVILCLEGPPVAKRIKPKQRPPEGGVTTKAEEGLPVAQRGVSPLEKAHSVPAPREVPSALQKGHFSRAESRQV